MAEIQRVTAAVDAAVWAAQLDVEEMKLFSADQAVVVARVAKAVTEAEAPMVVLKIESCTKALVEMTAQLDAKILAALSQVSAKLGAVEELLVKDELEVAQTCASSCTRLVIREQAAAFCSSL